MNFLFNHLLRFRFRFGSHRDGSFDSVECPLIDIHIVINSQEKDISTIMKGIAIRYASFYNTQHNRVGHVFQDRFKSESIEGERYLMAVIRYIHNNPVKAKVVIGQEYLMRNHKGVQWEQLKQDAIIKKEVIRHLRTETNLSIRTISKLLGIDKNMVERIRTRVKRTVPMTPKEPSP